MRTLLAILCAVSVLPPLFAAGPPDPADPDLMPEARRVWEYLHSIHGRYTLSGVSQVKNAEAIERVCGKMPALVAMDLSGWNSPTWGRTYTPVVEQTIESAKAWWAGGGIVTLQFHWKHPLKTNGTAWVGKHGNNPPSGPFDMAAAVQAGTPEHEAIMADLDRHADYLAQLAEARVPVLWRPFHEIDGGWFWWTDKEHPEAVAQMWRLMFDHLVHRRGIHNLIWVYSAGLHPAGKNRDVAQIDLRKLHYPGGDYVDISGIDIYPNEYYGWGRPQEDTYPKAYDIMSKVSPGKMLALCEGEAIPDPDRMMGQGPRWLYCLPWWGPGEKHSEDWIRKTYDHEFIITRDELPDFRKGAR